MCGKNINFFGFYVEKQGGESVFSISFVGNRIEKDVIFDRIRMILSKTNINKKTPAVFMQELFYSLLYYIKKENYFVITIRLFTMLLLPVIFTLYTPLTKSDALIVAFPLMVWLFTILPVRSYTSTN